MGMRAYSDGSDIVDFACEKKWFGKIVVPCYWAVKNSKNRLSPVCSPQKI